MHLTRPFVLRKSSAIPHCDFDVSMYSGKTFGSPCPFQSRLKASSIFFFFFLVFLDALPNETGPSSPGLVDFYFAARQHAYLEVLFLK